MRIGLFGKLFPLPKIPGTIEWIIEASIKRGGFQMGFDKSQAGGRNNSNNSIHQEGSTSKGRMSKYQSGGRNYSNNSIHQEGSTPKGGFQMGANKSQLGKKESPTLPQHRRLTMVTINRLLQNSKERGFRMFQFLTERNDACPRWWMHR